MCDAEILYSTLNGIDTEFVTEDPKNSPIRIYAVEVFAQSKKEFGYKEKIRKLEKIKEKQQEAKVNQTEAISNEDSILAELLKTNGIPLLTWKEKHQSLKDHKDHALILALDIVA